jgi:hypothetical protein
VVALRADSKMTKPATEVEEFQTLAAAVVRRKKRLVDKMLVVQAAQAL